MMIRQTVGEIWRFFDFSKMVAVRHIGFVMRVFWPPTQREYLVIFTAVQNLVGIGVVALKVCEFQYYASLAWKFTPLFGVKIGVKGNFLQFYPSRNAITWIKQRKNRLYGLASGSEQNLGVTKKLKTTREWYFSHVRDAPTVAIALNFGVRVDITDLITHTKFCVNRFRGFGVLIPPILQLSIGLAGRPYNSVITTVLHCDSETLRCCDSVNDLFVEKRRVVIVLVLRLRLVGFVKVRVRFRFSFSDGTGTWFPDAECVEFLRRGRRVGTAFKIFFRFYCDLLLLLALC